MKLKNGVAIDGPAGAGKSTVAKIAAKALGVPYLDTGAMYRALALQALEEGVGFEDEKSVAELLKKTAVKVSYLPDGQHVFVNGRDVTQRLREEAVGRGASDISKLPCVRDKMASLQREIAHETCAVLDGREIGTFVIPETPYKFFVTADPEERAARRVKQLAAQGKQADFASVLQDMLSRDRQDMTRSYAPLKQAADALLIDTTHKTAEEAAAIIIKAVEAQA